MWQCFIIGTQNSFNGQRPETLKKTTGNKQKKSDQKKTEKWRIDKPLASQESKVLWFSLNQSFFYCCSSNSSSSSSSSSSMGRLLLFLIILTFLALSFLSEVQSASFKIVNKCRHPIWPGLLSGATSPPLPTTGFALKTGKSKTVNIPKSWSGRLWARTLCGPDSEGKFSCVTADCGSGKVQCAGGGAKPPATLAEFTLNGADGLDFYDVSLVDGYNLPMLIVAKGGKRGGCSATGCLVDLNGGCPADLRVAPGNGTGRGNVACRSACEAFGDPQYCCSDAYSTPDVCHPSVYSQFFKHACPRAYSYAYDDKTSTYTCASADYLIIFCPLPYTSQKVLGAKKDGAPLPLVNKTMMYLSRQHSGASSSSTSTALILMQIMAHATSVAAFFLFCPLSL